MSSVGFQTLQPAFVLVDPQGTRLTEQLTGEASNAIGPSRTEDGPVGVVGLPIFEEHVVDGRVDVPEETESGAGTVASEQIASVFSLGVKEGAQGIIRWAHSDSLPTVRWFLNVLLCDGQKDSVGKRSLPDNPPFHAIHVSVELLLGRWRVDNGGLLHVARIDLMEGSTL